VAIAAGWYRRMGDGDAGRPRVHRDLSARGDEGDGLAVVAASLGVDPRDVLVFGDMPNDLPMFEWAGWSSVAVAGAHPEVLAIADEVTLGCDEEGRGGLPGAAARRAPAVTGPPAPRANRLCRLTGSRLTGSAGVAGQSQPFDRAACTASMRLRALVLPIAAATDQAGRQADSAIQGCPGRMSYGRPVTGMAGAVWCRRRADRACGPPGIGMPGIPGGRAGRPRICSSCIRAAICWATRAAWIPWNRPSSQPTSWAWGDAQLRLGRRVAGLERQRQPLQLVAQFGR